MAHEIIPEKVNAPPPFRQMALNLFIEMVVYGILLVGYFFIVVGF